MTFSFPASWDRPGLEEFEFEGFIPLIGLDVSLLPPRRGMYVVLREARSAPVFLATNPITRREPYPIERLEKKVTRGHEIVYIGSTDGAGGLRDRLGVFSTQSSSHTGGRALWQLNDARKLIAAWKETPTEASGVVESRWLLEFKREHGAYPLANWRS